MFDIDKEPFLDDSAFNNIFFPNNRTLSAARRFKSNILLIPSLGLNKCRNNFTRAEQLNSINNRIC